MRGVMLIPKGRAPLGVASRSAERAAHGFGGSCWPLLLLLLLVVVVTGAAGRDRAPSRPLLSWPFHV